jgi:hypothetical protein
MKYRREQAARDAELEAKIDAILNGQKNAQSAPQGIQGKIEAQKEAVKEKADALLESPALRTILAFLLCVGCIMLGHAVYKKCHADRAKIDKDLDDKNLPGLKSLFDKLDDFNTKVDTKLHGVNQAQAKTNSDLVQVALATPAPSQVAPAVAPVAAPSAK